MEELQSDIQYLSLIINSLTEETQRKAVDPFNMNREVTLEELKRKFVRWQAILALCIVFAIISLPIPTLLLRCLYPTSLFLLMYILRRIKENALVNFLSSISLEMFIIQFIPIYIMMDDLHVKSTTEMVLLVLGIDVIVAYIMHLVVQRISVRLR